MRGNRFIALGTGILALGLAGPEDASAKGAQQYAVEISCGDNDGSFEGVVPGLYATVVNVLNAGTRDVWARAQVVLTSPHRVESDAVGALFDPGEARSLDCDDLMGGTFLFPDDPGEGFFQGFLRIQAESDLNVVARYTTSGSTGEASSQVVSAEGLKIKLKRPKKSDDVEICHVPPGNPGNAHTIEVGSAAVSAHIAHGDYRGRCYGD